MKRFLIAISIVVAAPVFAQTGLHPVSARNMALAGSAGITMKGWEAVGINPAAIGQYEASRYVIGIAPAGGMLGNTNLNIDFYNTYFTGETVNGEKVRYDLDKGSRKKEFLSNFDPENTVFASGAVQVLAFSIDYAPWGSFAVTWGYKGEGHAILAPGLFERLLNGVEPGGNYDLSGMGGEAQIRSELAINYSRSIDEWVKIPYLSKLSAGGALKIENGVTYLAVENASHSLSVDPETSEYTHSFVYEIRGAGNNDFSRLIDQTLVDDEMLPFISPNAGFGLGLDLGVAGEVMGWPVFLSITDIGYIDWDKNATVISGQETIVFTPGYTNGDGTTGSTFETDTLKSSYQPTRRKESFTSYLPTTLRMGTRVSLNTFSLISQYQKHFSIPGEFIAYAGYQQGLNEGPGNTYTPQLSLGLEWTLKGWYARLGQAFGANDGYNWGMGGGYSHPRFRIDAGTAYFHHLFTGDSRTRLSAAITSQIFF